MLELSYHNTSVSFLVIYFNTSYKIILEKHWCNNNSDK